MSPPKITEENSSEIITKGFTQYLAGENKEYSLSKKLAKC